MKTLKICSNELIFHHFHKLCQFAAFWGRYLTWKKFLKNIKTFKIWSNELIFHDFSQAMSDYCFLRSLFSLRKHGKIWKHVLTFLSFSQGKSVLRKPKTRKHCQEFHFFQTMSDCYFLRLLFRLRKNWKYENFVIIFHKLCQTAVFWGCYLAWEKVLKYKNIENMVKRPHFSSFLTSYVRLLLFEVII